MNRGDVVTILGCTQLRGTILEEAGNDLFRVWIHGKTVIVIETGALVKVPGAEPWEMVADEMKRRLENEV